MKEIKKAKTESAVTGVLFILPVLACVVPFVLMALISLTQKRVVNLNFSLSEMDFQNYDKLFRNFSFFTYLLNSIIVVGMSCLLNCFISGLAGYSFAKKRFPLQKQIFWLYMITLMVPNQVILIPVFTIMRSMGLLNTHLALSLPIINAFGVFLIKQFMESVPDELLEAARMDGCGEFRIFTHIVVPLVKPVFVSLTVFTFITSWNDFIWPLVLITENKMNTLTLALASLQGNYGTNYGLVMAGATLAFLPPFILYLFLQRQFVEGIALSGIKG